MSKFGVKKGSIHDSADAEQVAHKHVPGRAYEVSDPVTKLIHTIGGGFFNEPKYYDSNRSAAAFYAELLSTGRISSKIVDETGLTEQAREVVETATAVANGESPEDLLVIAAWARDMEAGLKLRATPQIMLALAAAHPKAKPFVAKYATAIMRRADEIRQVFGAFRDLFMSAKPGEHPRQHRGSLPHALRKALAHALANQSEFALLKYNGSDRPTFADVLKMVGGSMEIGKYLQKVTGEKRPNWPVSKAMFEYLVNDKYIEPLPPILEARRQFFAMKDAAAVTLDLVKAAGLTWENVVSHLGSTKEVWELCVPIMGEMALTRNLRNFEQAGISASAWDQIYERMMGVEDTVQPAVLAMLTAQSRKHPSFQLYLGTAVRDLIRVGDRVVGVKAEGSDGPREFAADLIIGTDGRYSTVRKLGAFTELLSPQQFDVLNFHVPFPDFWPDRTTVRLELGPGCLTGGIPTADGRLWVGMTIQKGQYKALRTAGPDGLTEELLRRTSPDLAAHLRANAEALKHPVLLDVIVGRLETWTAPGLLLLGDAAHPMSPNGGQGINVALRDALVAANHLCPVLTRGNSAAVIDAAAQQVAAERMPEIVAIQEHQRKQTQTFLRSDRLSSRLAMWLLPLLAKSGLVRWLLGKRLRALQHGVVPVQLTA